jgi:glycosyltransferase involved in cell wall biosynthesis
MKRLRILWLSHFVPYPPKGGCFQRSYNLIVRAGATHDVHLIAMKPKASTHPASEMAGAREALLAHCRTVDIIDISAATRPVNLALRVASSVATGQPVTVTLFRSAAVEARVRARLNEGVDVLHLDSISLAEYLPEAGTVPTLMTHHGAESYMIRRRIANERSLVRKAFFGIEARTLERCERRVCPRVGMNVVMSALDRDLMAQVAPTAAYAVVENGVDVDLFAPQPVTAGHSLVFAGRLDQYSNRDAILHFMDTVWPRVAAAYPDAVIRIIGLNPPERLTTIAAADRRVEVLGFVDDIRPFFAASTAMICPIRDGGGTRIKILDALAQAKPIVSTSIGCEGIQVTPGRDVLIADDPEAFAHQIGRVFDDPALRASLARHARRLAEDVYSWTRLGGKLTALYEQLAHGSHVITATGTDGR